MKKLHLNKSYCFLFTLLFFIFVFSLFSLRAIGQEARENQLYEASCRISESNYVQKVREYLLKQGYENIGITINHIVDSDGSRSYRLWIHHRRLLRLSDGELADLVNELQRMGVSLPGEELSIRIE